MITSLVTIAIPVYNAENYLAYAIQSVVNQTFQDWHLLLLNDGSTDGSLKIMETFAMLDSRIHVINDYQNRGLIYRLNQSISLTKSKYYARMDADDIMAVSRISEQVIFLDQHPEIDLVGSSVMTIDNHNNIVGSCNSSGIVTSLIHPTIMGRTIWFKNNPYLPWAIRAEDFELWCRTNQHSKFWSIEKPLLFYREFGLPSFTKIYNTQKTLLKVYSRYKTYGKPLSWSINGKIKTYCKMFLYSIFNLFGEVDFIIRRRKRDSVAQQYCLKSFDLKESIQEYV